MSGILGIMMAFIVIRFLFIKVSRKLIDELTESSMISSTCVPMAVHRRIILHYWHVIRSPLDCIRSLHSTDAD